MRGNKKLGRRVTDSRQSIIGKACKNHQCQLDKNNPFSIFVGTEAIDLSSTYTLKYQKQIRGNP